VEVDEVRLVEARGRGDGLEHRDLLADVGVEPLQEGIGAFAQVGLELTLALVELGAHPQAGEQDERHECREHRGGDEVQRAKPVASCESGRRRHFDPLKSPDFLHDTHQRPAAGGPKRP
jgi:hypothetical protein